MSDPIPESRKGPTSKTLRCRYCIENREFKPMSGRDGDDWHICSNCGHLIMADNSAFKCPCARCAHSRAKVDQPLN